MREKLYNIKGNPFLQRSAEEELDFLDKIYYKPTYYDELIDNAINGASRMLVGKRGLGKSATIHYLFKELKQNQTLPLLITRYDNIPLINNENYFLYIIMSSMCNGIAQHLFEFKSDRKKLSKYEREQLSFFIELFYDPRTSEEYYKKAEEIKRKHTWNFLRIIYNKSLPLINGLLNGAIEFGSDFIRKSIGLTSTDIELQQVAKEYLHESELIRINSLPMSSIAEWEKDKLIKLLNKLKNIANKIGYKSIVILFDKIDEYSEVNANVDKIVDFIKDILLDTDFMYTEGLSIVFSIWSDARRALNKSGVRFDKFEDIDIEWSDIELEELINKRLKYYSIDKNNSITLHSLIPDDNDRNLVLNLANKSPRALIKLLSKFYNEVKESGIISFSKDVISKGMLHYCQSYDYYSNQSIKIGLKADLYSWINKILQIKRINFSIDDIKSTFEINPKNAHTYLQTMLKYELIKEDIKNENLYNVIDPRLCFLISRGYTELRT